MEAPVVEMEQVSKEYLIRGTPLSVLRGVDLTLERGDSIALVGASGSGKSTLLSLLAGLDTPTSGRVIVAGVDLTRTPFHRLAHYRFHHVGLVFQQHHLIPTLTTLENVMLPAAPWNPPYNVQQRALELLRLVNLTERIDHLPAQLSGGEQQRVCIARALLNRPTLLMADEPTGNLDEWAAADVLHLIGDLAARFEMTLLFVTHDMKVARSFRRVARMLDGHITAEKP